MAEVGVGLQPLALQISTSGELSKLHRMVPRGRKRHSCITALMLCTQPNYSILSLSANWNCVTERETLQYCYQKKNKTTNQKTKNQTKTNTNKRIRIICLNLSAKVSYSYPNICSLFFRDFRHILLSPIIPKNVLSTSQHHRDTSNPLMVLQSQVLNQKKKSTYIFLLVS